MQAYLDFETHIAELEGKIHALRNIEGSGEGADILEDIQKLEEKAHKLITQTYAKLTPWQKVQVARHPDRPKTMTYIDALFTHTELLAGDRAFQNDNALVGGLARFHGHTCVVLGQEKGGNTEGRIAHNFGMVRPEGYRKAQRLMRMAQHFQLPLFTFIDTPGADPGIGAEERGQAESIARSIEMCLSIDVPIITVIIGEGGSGGAVAIGVADQVIMLEHAIYALISPEGCASILWRDQNQAQQAAEVLRLTAQDLLKFKIIDRIVPEPPGGAQRHPANVIEAVDSALFEAFQALQGTDPQALKNSRRERYLAFDGTITK